MGARGVLQLQQLVGNRAVTEMIQRSVATDQAGNAGQASVRREAHDGPSVVDDAAAMVGGLGQGQRLDGSVASRLGKALGGDFSQVRVHTGASAASAASALDARAFTYGPHIGFDSGEYQPGTPVGDAVLAHELAHVNQQRGATATVGTALRGNGSAASGSGHDDRTLEQDADRAATSAIARLWTATSDVANGLLQAPERLRTARPRLQRCVKSTTPAPQTPSDPQTLEEIITSFEEAARELEQREQPEPQQAEAVLREVTRVLPVWKARYDSAQRMIKSGRNGDAELTLRLKTSYEKALAALRRLQRHTPRVNIVLVGAPNPNRVNADAFLTRAAQYASAYFTSPPTGDTVVRQDDVASLDQLLSAVEAAEPERMVRRVDIFMHGTNDPENHLFLAEHHYSAQDIQAAFNAREFTSEHLQSASRFDGQTSIEVHGCRLGGGEGRQFLTEAGRALGGAHGQEVAGYTEFLSFTDPWVDWRGHRVRDTEADVYSEDSLPVRHGRRGRRQAELDRAHLINHFERRAVTLFDRVLRGSQELDMFLRSDERAAGPFSRERKIRIMRDLYDRNGAWLFAFLHPRRQHRRGDPEDIIGRPDITFTREQDDWEDRTVRVRVNP